MILDELIASLESGLERNPIQIAQACVGVFYTAVQLSDGHAGVAFTPRDLADTVCCPRTAAEFPNAGKLSGQSAWDLAQQALSPHRLRRAVGLATLNALSARLMEEKGIPGGRILNNTDALDLAQIKTGDRVVMIGAFVPFIRKLKGQGIDLKIIDKHQDALKFDELPFWTPPEASGDILPKASVVIISGSALVEGGLDELLELSKNAREIILAGPTASPWPEPFFARGVTILGGIRVTDGNGFMCLVAEGGSGYFFTGPAEKIVIVKENATEPISF